MRWERCRGSSLHRGGGRPGQMEADNGIEARGQLERLVATYLVVVTREAMTGWKGSDTQARGRQL
jgi:hypothetical protein